MKPSKRRGSGEPSLQPVAGRGLLDGRALLGGGLALAGAMGARVKMPNRDGFIIRFPDRI